MSGLDNVERRKENAEAAKIMAALIHKGRRVGFVKATRLAEGALRRFPMARYPHRKERLERCIDWIFARTKPRVHKAMASDSVVLS